ncbi:hypothetical protein [Alloacidobacterium sp.]|uniref:hypothetical protein n=1 Tax=Alloacidobacterium sp. TaxID=2951999 RepID=UPI002D36E8F0|nr:hypothetical protein [Alloacidobacterium sp.]HYK35176.1 hypothetical protein [Alloacidobacterium sp.]
MRSTRFSCLALVAIAILIFSASCHAQSQSQSQVQAQAQNPPAPAPSAPSGALSGVRYDYKWELYGGFAYSHFNAGPNLLQGANLGGFDAQAARFFTPRWAVAGNVRGYYGTSGVVPNPYGIEGPFVSEHMFLVGPEYRGPSNVHGSILLHALVGGAYGDFQHATGNVPPGALGLFSNQFAFGAAFGGSIDLNRSPRLVFRISPDATLTNFGGAGLKDQFAISVGILYRMKKGLK